MNLIEFIKDKETKMFPNSAYIDEPGFETLYVRYTKRYLIPGMHKPLPCLDIARVATLEYGKGTFTRMIEKVQTEFPYLWIYVEAVMSERFIRGLQNMGFILLEEFSRTPSLYLRPKPKIDKAK